MSIFDRSSTVILGESGCGREIIARVLAGNVEIDSGQLLLGKSIKKGGPENYIQFVPDDIADAVNPRFSIEQAVCEGLIIQDTEPAERVSKKCLKLLRSFGFTEHQIKSRFSDLPTYKKILVVIARALMLRPRILVFSEIFNVLFFTEKDKLIKILAAIQNKYWLSYIFLTNDMYAARFLCDKAILMCAGRIMESGLLDKIFITPLHPYSEAMLWSDCIKQGTKPVICQGEVEGYSEYTDGCPFSNRCRFALPQCLKGLPGLVEAEKGHFVRCIRHDELKLRPIID